MLAYLRLGAIGGGVCGTLLAIVVAFLTDLQVSWWLGALIGIALGVGGVLATEFESPPTADTARETDDQESDTLSEIDWESQAALLDALWRDIEKQSGKSSEDA